LRIAITGAAGFIGSHLATQRNTVEAANSEHHTLIELGEFAAQGATFGAIYIFITAVFYLGLHPDAYLFNYLAISGLPRLLLAALVIGLCAGLTMWGCWRLCKRRLGRISRACIGILLLIVAYFATAFLWPSNSTEPEELTWLTVGWTLFFGSLFGLFTGSSLNPIRALSRGTDRRSLLAITSGVVLRLVVVFLLMESILLLIGLRGLSYTRRDLFFILLAFGHCSLSALLVFSRSRLILLCVLAFIVNLPTASLFFLLPASVAVFRYIILAYLACWAVYLVSRSALVHSLMSNVSKEVKYYLID
jgi:hypothetical protein